MQRRKRERENNVEKEGVKRKECGEERDKEKRMERGR
jgi:hypothetical protein